MEDRESIKQAIRESIEKNKELYELLKKYDEGKYKLRNDSDE